MWKPQEQNRNTERPVKQCSLGKKEKAKLVNFEKKFEN